MNGKIELIGIDLDGTLLNDEKQLCSGAEKTIKRAYENGIHIVPITGRPLLGIPKCITELDEIEYVISSNGAQTTQIKTNKTIHSCTISNSRSKEIMKMLRSLNLVFEPFTEGYGYSESDVYNHYLEYFKGTPIEEYIISSRRVVNKIEELYENGSRQTDEFFVHCQNEKNTAKLLNILMDTKDLQFCILGNRFVEITKKGCDKGEALEKLCKSLNIDVKNSLAFGDGENDLLFLEKAGTAVAMDNAFESVKKKADFIAKSNNENGVCDMIEKLCF